MDDSARLESVYRRKAIMGSNPIPTARMHVRIIYPLLLIFTFVVSAFGLLMISLSRQNLFLEHLENFPIEKLSLVLGICLVLLVGYYVLVFGSQSFSPQFLRLLVCLVWLTLFLAFPFLSRDIFSYVLPARNFVWLGQNPYHVPVGSDLNLWTKELGNLWWLNFPSAYGPIFLLISSLAVLPHLSSLMATVYIYKTLVLLGCVFSVIFFKKINELLGGRNLNVYLFALNPALLIHGLLDGHNEIFVTLFLLLSIYLFLRGKNTRSYFGLLSAILVKFSALIFLPVFWFKEKKVALKEVFLTVGATGLSFLLFFFIFRLNLGDLSRVTFFSSAGCLYACSPMIIITEVLFKGNAVPIRLVFWIFLYIFLIWRFLWKENNFLKFIFWSYTLMLFTYVKWLGPWYPVLVLPIGLLIGGKLYKVATYLLTAYSLLHFWGI